MTPLMNIGEAAAAAGVSAKMVRHYEQIGLLPAAERSESGYRLYGEREVSVLRFIRQSRRLGFSVAQIAELIGLWSDSRRSSREVKAVAQRHLADLEEKRREIEQMMDGLSVLVQACHGNDQPHCAILDKLSLHSPAQHQPEHKPQLRKGRLPRDEVAGERSSSPIDLMAWMRGVQVHQAGQPER
ncbi:MAG: Cu(I)-responsive transcriptional regulator [Hydrogenophaga sp.]|uniref:Cu(I)-responsive transcriptional regulator n=1 Tax=Hydrogenophaga sp. TaxID=1904254 RepID=UPI0040368467